MTACMGITRQTGALMKVEGRESRAEVFMMALESFSEAEKRLVASRLLDYPYLREDVLDIAIIRDREGEPSYSIEEVMASKGAVSLAG